MKKMLLFTTGIVLAATVFSQAVKDTYYYMGYDTIKSSTWSGTTWVPSKRSIFVNNPQCLATSVLDQNWQAASSSYINSALTTVSYRPDNQVSNTFGQSWDQASSSWLTGARVTDHYNSVNLPDSTIGETLVNGTWQRSYAFGYSYNPDATVYQIVEQIFVANTAYITRLTYSYPDNTYYQVLTESSSNGNWVPSARLTITYLGTKAKVNTSLTETWVVNQWVKSSLQTFTYDNNNSYRIKMVSQLWNAASQSYVNNSQSIYTNNANGTVAEELDQQWNTATSAWVNQTLSDYTYGCNVILPLTLVNFTAFKSNSSAMLNWQTTNEINTAHFRIQRSVNGTSFTDIGTVTAQGSANAVQNYSFTDNITTVNSGTVYYRVMTVDKDGKEASSKIVSLYLLSNDLVFNVMPNPAHDFITITTGAENVAVTIAQLSGQVIIKQNINAAGQHQLHISSLAKGIYLVNIATAEKVVTRKLVVE